MKDVLEVMRDSAKFLPLREPVIHQGLIGGE